MEGREDKKKENNIVFIRSEWIKESMGGRKDKKKN
jgi:hypothetical protein